MIEVDPEQQYREAGWWLAELSKGGRVSAFSFGSRALKREVVGIGLGWWDTALLERSDGAPPVPSTASVKHLASHDPLDNDLPFAICHVSKPQDTVDRVAIRTGTMTEPDLHHFQSFPWCAKVLADPDFTIVPTRSRSAKADTEDSFFAATLQTDQTVRACLSLFGNSTPPSNKSGLKIQRVRTLLSLGSGVNGYHNIAHGGLVATLLDQGMGILVEENFYNGSGKWGFTAYLNVKYRAPVPTPGVVLLTAAYTKIVLRKHFMKATLENGEGTVYAEAEALFVEMKPKL